MMMMMMIWEEGGDWRLDKEYLRHVGLRCEAAVAGLEGMM